MWLDLINDPKAHDSLEVLMELNQFTREDCSPSFAEYNMKHCSLLEQYALLLAEKLEVDVDPIIIKYVAWSHDLLKEKSLSKDQEYKYFRDFKVPQDINRYIRTNMDLLESFKLDLYFNSDIQLHSQAAAIFLYHEFKVNDERVLYPVFFHSCPIISVYETLSYELQTLVDITMLADKLSSNYLRINYNGIKVPVNLETCVFGSDGSEFNYSLGLLLARMIGQGNSKEVNSIKATEFYFKRASEINPLLKENFSFERKGVYKLWPKRKSLLVKML